MPVILQRHKSGALTQLSVLLCNRLLLCNILLRSILVELEYLEISDRRMTSLTNQAFERRSDYILKYQTWVIKHIMMGETRLFETLNQLNRFHCKKMILWWIWYQWWGLSKLLRQALKNVKFNFPLKWHTLPQKSHCKYFTVNVIYVQWFSVVLVLSIELNLHLNWNNQSRLTKFKGLLHPHVVPNP